MLRFIRLIWYMILTLIVVALVIVAMANFDMVTLETLPPVLSEQLPMMSYSIQLPLYVVVLGSVAVGLLLGFIIEWLRESKHRSEASRRQNQVRQLNSEMTRLKGQTNAGKDEILALLDDAPKATS